MPADKIAATFIRNSPGPQSHPTSQKEQTARVAVETQLGRKLTDAEWEHARATLVEYALLLRDWRRDLINHRTGLANAA